MNIRTTNVCMCSSCCRPVFRTLRAGRGQGHPPSWDTVSLSLRGSTAHTRAREAITRICRGKADARTLRLEALDAIRHGLARTFVPATGGDQLPAGPVVLLLSAALEVRAQTPQTQRYLQVLVPPEAEDQAPVPAGAYNVAAQLLAVEAGVDDNQPVARVHLAAGRWVTLRAARMGTNPATPANPAGAGPDVAVSIEPSTAGDRVTVFARACGLTPREAEVLQHLAGGATTREVARQKFDRRIPSRITSSRSSIRARPAADAPCSPGRSAPDRVFGVYIMQLCAESPAR